MNLLWRKQLKISQLIPVFDRQTTMTFEQVHDNQQVLLLQCISGSKAYGLDSPQSDTDVRGVFALEKKEFYGLRYTEQVENVSNDVVYYELKRFVGLLVKNNPNILELLNTPADKILFRHPIMDRIQPDMVLSKRCAHTFAGYALSQIKKVQGLNKKIFNPVEEKRKNILDFCFIVQGYDTVPLLTWLQQQNYNQENCGLVNVTHCKNVYALFHQSQTDATLYGICSHPDANDIQLSSIPKQIQPKALLSFNKDAYSIYCKEYAQYWHWVETRNDARFQHTLKTGKNYDSKNMMHTFRLLHMAEEIAREKQVYVRRPDKDFLLQIKNGDFLYDDLVQMANEKIQKIDTLYAQSDLPDHPDETKLNEVLVEMRESLLKSR